MGLETFQKALRRCRIKFGDEWDQSQLSSSNRLGARAKKNKLKNAFSQWEAPWLKGENRVFAKFSQQKILKVVITC